MEKLFLEPTDDCPAVDFDPISGTLRLAGRSIQEDASTFYDPLYEWIGSYKQSPAPKTVLELQLEYMNSLATRKIVGLIFELDDCYSNGVDAQVTWLCRENDDVMRERGEELKNIADLPFEICLFN